MPGSSATRSDDDGSFVVRLNDSGLRGADLSAADAAPAADRRIAFVGDSFLVGEALRDEQLVSFRVGAALRERGESAEVFNLAAVDTGTAQQLLMLREFGPRIRPSEVVLFVYSGNDLINNEIELAGRSSVSAGDYIRPYLVEGTRGLERTYTHPGRAWLRHHSRLYAEIERRLLGLGTRPRFAWLSPWPEPVTIAESLRSGRAPGEELEVLRDHDPGDRWEKAWHTTERLLVAFRAECDALGARLLVVVVPNAFQVMRNAKGIRLDLASQALAGQSIDRLLDWDLPARRFVALGEAHGIEVWPLLPSLRAAAAAGGAPPYGRDDHLSASGHELAEQIVLAWLDGDRPDTSSLATRGRPVWMIPDDPALAWLDFQQDPHSAYLGDGWLRFEPAASGRSGSWTAGPRALVVVRLAGGDLIVRGEVSGDLELPIRGSVAATGSRAVAFVIDEHGPFELRSDLRSAGRPPAEGLGGLVPIEFASGPLRFVDGRLIGLKVHEIGFAAASPH